MQSGIAQRVRQFFLPGDFWCGVAWLVRGFVALVPVRRIKPNNCVERRGDLVEEVLQTRIHVMESDERQPAPYARSLARPKTSPSSNSSNRYPFSDSRPSSCRSALICITNFRSSKLNRCRLNSEKRSGKDDKAPVASKGKGKPQRLSPVLIVTSCSAKQTCQRALSGARRPDDFCRKWSLHEEE